MRVCWWEGEMSADSERSPGKGEVSRYTARLPMTDPDTCGDSRGLLVSDMLHEDSTANNMGNVTPSLHRAACLYFPVSLCA